MKKFIKASLIWIGEWFIGVGDALSKLGNALIKGPINESLSARAYRQHDAVIFWNLMYHLINFLALGQDNHCKRVFEKDQERNAAALAQGVQTCLQDSGKD